MHSIVKTWAGKGARTAFALALAAGMGAAWAHGDVTPQPVDTSTLPQVGAKWLEDNPYSKGPARAEAMRSARGAVSRLDFSGFCGETSQTTRSRPRRRIAVSATWA